MELVAPAEGIAFRDLAATVQAVRTSLPTTLTGFIVVNNQAAVTFVQFFDVATAGAVTLATTNPDLEVSVAANATLPIFLPSGGRKCRFGLQVAATTTEKGLTGSAAGVQLFVLVVN